MLHLQAKALKDLHLNTDHMSATALASFPRVCKVGLRCQLNAYCIDLPLTYVCGYSWKHSESMC